jgi:hypothetical protein
VCVLEALTHAMTSAVGPQWNRAHGLLRIVDVTVVAAVIVAIVMAVRGRRGQRQGSKA